MVFHRHFCGIFHLIQVLIVKLGQSSCSHGAGSADFCLAAGFCTGDRGVALGEIADDTGGGKSPDDLLVGETLGVLGIFENCG